MTENSEDKAPSNEVTTSTGETFKFSTLMAGDILDATKELGCSIEEAPPFECSLVLTWRSAVRGGFEGDFRAFVDSIPMTEVEQVVKTATPFLGTPAAQK